MWNWYWALEGWNLLAATVGCIAASLAGLALATAGLARWIVQGFEHADHCTCPQCQIYRQREWSKLDKKRRREWEQLNHELTENRDLWISTLELSIGMRIGAMIGRQMYLYQVEDIQIKVYGHMIWLRNLETNAPSLVTIHTEHLERKTWQFVSRPRRKKKWFE